MDEQIIELYAHVAHTACLRMTPQHLAALQSSLDQTSCLSARLQWDRKATAHAEMFNLLADVLARSAALVAAQQRDRARARPDDHGRARGGRHST